MATKKSKKNVNSVLIIGGAIVALAIIAAVIIFVRRDSKPAEESVNVGDGVSYDYQKTGALKLGTYKDIVVSTKPTDEDLQSAIEMFCEDNGKTEDAIVKKGDIVNIDFVGSLDGVEFEGGSGEGETLTVGEYSYLEDFENGLIGKEVGTTVKVPVKFPDDYGDEELNGKQAEFSITINAINIAFTDENVNKVTKGKYKTTKEYEKKLEADLVKENEEAAADTAWDQLKEATTLNTVPEDVQKQAEADTDLMYQQFAALQGMEVSELLEQLGMTEDDVPEMATDMAKERMIAKTIAAIEKITMDDTYYEKALREAVGEEEDTEESSLAELEASYKESQSARPKDDMLILRVKDYINESVKLSNEA